MKDLIDALKGLQLDSHVNNDDALCRNLFKIGKIFHAFKMQKYLKNPTVLSNFIIKYFNKEDNKILFMIGSFYLKQYNWLAFYLKTIYYRPDIDFLYKPLYYPEIKTAKDFKNIIGKFQLIQTPLKKHTSVCGKDNTFCLSDIDIHKQTKQFLQDLNDYNYNNDFYIKLNENFKDLILTTNFNCMKAFNRNPMFNSIRLVLQDNGYVLGVYNAEIGHTYLFYIPLTEILKLYKQARIDFDKEGQSIKFKTLKEIQEICNHKNWQLIHEDDNTYSLEDLTHKNSMTHGVVLKKINTFRDVQIYFDRFDNTTKE